MTKQAEHRRAIRLRQRGYSVIEIAGRLRVSKSTASLWVRDVVLSDTSKARILKRIKLGPLISAERKKAASAKFNAQLATDARDEIRAQSLTASTERLLCALLYWCEGAKSYRAGVAFTNSDPALTRVFIDLLVRHFGVCRTRIVCRLHLHEYHDEATQVAAWATWLAVASSQFRKTYRKPHTAVRTREGYPGCIAIRVHDSILARKLMYLAQAYTTGA